MTKSQELYNKAVEAGTIEARKEYLKFKGTGKHVLEFVEDSIVQGKNFRTGKPEKKMRYIFKEDGVEKIYETAVFKKDDSGDETKEFSSFITQIQPYSYGDVLQAEYTPIAGTPRGFVKVSEVEPTIDDGEDDYSNPEDF